MALNPIVFFQKMKDSGCFDFLSEKAESALRRYKEESPELRELLGESAEKDARNSFKEQLTNIYAHSTVMELGDLLRTRGLPMAAMMAGAEEEQVEQGMRDLAKDADVCARINKKCPLLAGYEKNFVELFGGNLKLLFSRLAKNRQRVSEAFFGGREIKLVTALALGDGDTHRHGQTVARVGTDAGAFYYKPHDCGLDAFYEELTEKWFSDCMTAAKVVEGKGYAFVSELKPEEMKDKKDIETYFYHLGIMMAMFHGLASRDMHTENVMACGVKPAVLDVETLLAPQRATLKPDDLSYYTTNSVIGTSMLPGRIHKLGMISALHKPDEPTMKACSLPIYKGEQVGVEGYEEVFIRGFRKGYRRMMDHRDEFDLLLERHTNSAVRFVKYNTSYYYLVRRDLYRQENMATEEARDKAADKLRIPMKLDWKDSDQVILDYEKENILRGDIPYYCVPLEGKALAGETPEDILQEDFFKASPRQTMRERLAYLSDADELFEEDWLRNSLSAVPANEEKETKEFPLPEHGLSPEDMKAMAEGLWTQLLAFRMRRPDGLPMWHSVALGLDSYLAVMIVSNWSDLALSVSEAVRFGFPESEEMARFAVRGLTRWVEMVETEKKGVEILQTDEGIYTGNGGFILACLRLHQAKLADMAPLLRRFIPLMRKSGFAKAKKMGFGYGLAGLLLALAKACREESLRSEELVLAMKECATELLAREWPKDSGGIEGLCGIAAALADASACLKDESMADGALRALETVKKDYKADIQGWIRSDEKLPWIANAAPWAADIAWYAMEAEEALAGTKGEAAAREVLRLALDSLCGKDVLLTRDSLFEGNAMAVMSLTRAAKKLGDPVYGERAKRTLAAMRERCKEKGNYRVTESGIRSFFDSSFYAGSMGIAYSALYCMKEG